MPSSDKEKIRAYKAYWLKTPKGRLYTQRHNKRRYRKHPELTKKLADQFYFRRSALLAGLKNKPCLDCQGWFESYQMEFDHRDPHTKLACVGTIVTGSLQKLLFEINKCDLVCSNCHRKRTYERRQYVSNLRPSRYHVRNKLSANTKSN